MNITLSGSLFAISLFAGYDMAAWHCLHSTGFALVRMTASNQVLVDLRKSMD